MSIPYNLEIKFVCGICGHSVEGKRGSMCIGEMLPLYLPPEGWSVVSLSSRSLYDQAIHRVSRDFNSSFTDGNCPVVICPEHSIVVD